MTSLWVVARLTTAVLAVAAPAFAQYHVTGPVTHVRDGRSSSGGVPVCLEGLHCPEWDELGNFTRTAM